MTANKLQTPLHQAPIVVNGRYRVHRITGVQRYAHEIVTRLRCDLELRSPESAKGVAGHLWEQTVLPWIAGDRVLWSPCGSGPLSYDRQVVTFHDLFPLENPEWYSPAYARWYAFAMRRLAARSLHLIAVSEYTKSRLVKLLGRDPDSISVIHNGSQMTGRATEEQIRGARASLKLPTRRYVLSLSSRESRKNLATTLKAWARLHKVLPDDVWLVLAGPCADESIYGRQEGDADLPRVLYTGYVPEEHLCGLYSGASLFVFPSLAEGFGLPLLEAMACGVRCITSNTSSLPEVGGDVVEYINPLDVDALVYKVRQMMQTTDGLNPFVPVMERAKQFTWSDAARCTFEVLEHAVKDDARMRLPLLRRIAI